eukprot:Filipodium_phascolosomae@DN2797_c1_g1_i55.p1
MALCVTTHFCCLLFPRTGSSLCEFSCFGELKKTASEKIDRMAWPLCRNGPRNEKRELDMLDCVSLIYILHPSHMFVRATSPASAGEVIYKILGSKDELIT